MMVTADLGVEALSQGWGWSEGVAFAHHRVNLQAGFLRASSPRCSSDMWLGLECAQRRFVNKRGGGLMIDECQSPAHVAACAGPFPLAEPTPCQP
jgi:hypothetical protein